MGTRTYAEQTENSKKLELNKLHEELVNRIISWLKEKGLNNIDTVYLSVDGLQPSIEYGKWAPCTDSALSLRDKDNGQVAISC